MEYVDVVDEQNEIIRRELKEVCHANGLLHRGAALLLFRDDSLKELLLQKRSQGVRNGGRWCNPGGHVLSGETYEDAVKREGEEELFSKFGPTDSFPIARLERLFTFLKDEPEDREFIAVFRAVNPGPFHQDPAEVEALQFFNVDMLKGDIKLHPERYTTAFLQIFEKYLNQ